MPYQRGNYSRDSSFNPYRRPDRDSYSSPGRRSFQDEYSSAGDSSSFGRSQFNHYGSTDRRPSQEMSSSRLNSTFARPSHDYYGPTDRQSSQYGYNNRGSNSFSERPPFSFHETEGSYTSEPSRPYSSETDMSRGHQSYNSHRRGGSSQTSFERKDPTEDIQRFQSPKQSQVGSSSSVRNDNSSTNRKDCEGSDDDDDDNDDYNSIPDLDSEENLLKYIDILLSQKQNQLQKAIRGYNESVRKFNALGRVFRDQREKKTYMHWRRSIKAMTGFLKADISQIPPHQFNIDDFLIDESQLLGLDSSAPTNISEEVSNSGLPSVVGHGATKGTRRRMKHRLALNIKLEFETIALEKLKGNAELKKQLFGDFAMEHFKAKATNNKIELKKIIKRIRNQIKQLGAENC